MIHNLRVPHYFTSHGPVPVFLQLPANIEVIKLWHLIITNELTSNLTDLTICLSRVLTNLEREEVRNMITTKICKVTFEPFQLLDDCYVQLL